MQIYNPEEHNEICYSVKMSKSVKKNIAYIKKHFVRDNVTSVEDIDNSPLFINKDRKQSVYMKIEGSFLPDIYLYHSIVTKTNLSIVSNQRSVFLVGIKDYFRHSTGLIPFTHAIQYLNTFKHIWLYHGITVAVYRRLIPIKLGFFGTHLQRDAYFIRTIRYKDR